MIGRFGDPVVVVDAGPAAYLWHAFLDLGPARATAMGREPWDWGNVTAFAASCLPDAEAWEVRALFDMSRAYCRTVATATDPFALSPVEIAIGEDWRSLIPSGSKPGEVVTISLPGDP